MVEKGVEICGMAAREYQDAQLAAAKYGRVGTKEGLSWDYKRNYPTEALILTSTMYYMQNGDKDSGNVWIR